MSPATLLTICLLLLSSFVLGDQSFAVGNYRLDVSNSNAKLTYRLKNSTSTGTSFAVSLLFDQLEEYGQQGILQRLDMSKAAFGWSNPAAVMIGTNNDIPADKVTWSSGVSGIPIETRQIGSGNSFVPSGYNANVRIDVYFIRGNGIVLNGNQPIPVYTNSIKFNLHVDNWNFTTNAQYFRARLRLQDTSELSYRNIAAGENNRTIERPDAKTFRMRYAGVDIDIPNKCVIDGATTDLSNIPIRELPGVPGDNAIWWGFPIFRTSLDFDPVVKAADQPQEPNTATIINSSYSFILCTFLALLAMKFF